MSLKVLVRRDAAHAFEPHWRPSWQAIGFVICGVIAWNSDCAIMALISEVTSWNKY